MGDEAKYSFPYVCRRCVVFEKEEDNLTTREECSVIVYYLAFGDMFSFHYGIHFEGKGIDVIVDLGVTLKEVMKTPKDFESGGNSSSYLLGLCGNYVESTSIIVGPK